MIQNDKTTVAVVIGLCALIAQPIAALEVTQDEVNAFLAADKDQNMSLDREEFPIFVRHMARVGQPTARTIVTFKAFGYAFKRADINGDRKVTPQELRTSDDQYRAEQN
ncbi:hypothetical protein [Planktotalea sp.]|uniref:hypothetical protein n=1 Tax=Planktotalea sp. TaxID=2029877 RepID=UPI003D6A436C